MRDFLTGFAAFLIVLLTAALAAPYLIDWNGQRGFVEARLSRALGQKVTIGGAIDLKLLPTPYLVLDQAVIGRDDGAVRIGIRHLDLELSVTPLLHGEFEVVEALLDEPVIRLSLRDDHSLPPLPDAPALRADVRFDRITLRGGTLAIADPMSGHTFSLDHLDLDAEAESLAGPFKGTGAAGDAAARTKFRFLSSVIQGGRAHARLAADETARHPGFEIDGTLSVVPEAGGLRESFEGTGALSGHLGAGAALPLPWRISGPLVAGPRSASLRNGEVKVGPDEHALSLAANGDAVFSAAPSLHLGLAAKQIDLDRLFGGGVSDTGEAVPPKIPGLASLRQMAEAATPPLPLSTDLAIDNLSLDGETVSGLKAGFVLGGAGPQPVRLAGEGPGHAHLALAGTLSPQPGTDFTGLFDVSTGNAFETAAWLGRIAPGFARPAQDFPFRTASLKGDIRLAAGGLEGSGLSLRLDRSALTGMLAFEPARDGHAALLKAALQSRALDLDTIPGLDSSTGPRDFDLDLHLEADTIKVASLGGARADAGHIDIGLRRAGAHLALSPFKITGLGGAAVDAEASFDKDGGRIKARLTGNELTGFSTLVKRLFPDQWATAFATRAAVLAPAELSLDAAFKAAGTSGFTLASALASGTLAQSKFDVALSPDPGGGTVSGHAALSAREGGALLRQIGIPALPLDNLGPGDIKLSVHGPVTGPLDATLHASLGAIDLDANGHVPLDFSAATAHADGSVKLTSPDVSPLLQSLAIAFPDMLGQIPVSLESTATWKDGVIAFDKLSGRAGGSKVTGNLAWSAARSQVSGSLGLDHFALASLTSLALGPVQPAASGAIWSKLPFGTGLIDPPRMTVDLKIDRLALPAGQQAEDASLGLDLAPGLVAIKALSARTNGGTLSASLDLHRDGASASLTGRLALDGVTLRLPSARGQISAKLDLAGGGRTMSGLMESLAGSGTASIDNLEIPNADPEAFSKVFADVEADRIAVDEAALSRALDVAATAGPLRAGSPRFTLGLAAGVLHFDEVPPAQSPAVAAALDIRQGMIDERATETLTALPKNWQGAAPRVEWTYAGPLEAPRRSGDVSGFVNAVAARALARETARIEAYEADVRERAFFNQRLKLEHARAEEQRARALLEQRAKALEEQLKQDAIPPQSQSGAPLQIAPPAR